MRTRAERDRPFGEARRGFEVLRPPDVQSVARTVRRRSGFDGVAVGLAGRNVVGANEVVVGLFVGQVVRIDVARAAQTAGDQVGRRRADRTDRVAVDVEAHGAVADGARRVPVHLDGAGLVLRVDRGGDAVEERRVDAVDLGVEPVEHLVGARRRLDAHVVTVHAELFRPIGRSGFAGHGRAVTDPLIEEGAIAAAEVGGQRRAITEADRQWAIGRDVDERVVGAGAARGAGRVGRHIGDRNVVDPPTVAGGRAVARQQPAQAHRLAGPGAEVGRVFTPHGVAAREVSPRRQAAGVAVARSAARVGERHPLPARAVVRSELQLAFVQSRLDVVVRPERELAADAELQLGRRQRRAGVGGVGAGHVGGADRLSGVVVDRPAVAGRQFGQVGVAGVVKPRRADDLPGRRGRDLDIVGVAHAVRRVSRAHLVVVGRSVHELADVDERRAGEVRGEQVACAGSESRHGRAVDVVDHRPTALRRTRAPEELQRTDPERRGARRLRAGEDRMQRAGAARRRDGLQRIFRRAGRTIRRAHDVVVRDAAADVPVGECVAVAARHAGRRIGDRGDGRVGPACVARAHQPVFDDRVERRVVPGQIDAVVTVRLRGQRRHVGEFVATARQQRLDVRVDQVHPYTAVRAAAEMVQRDEFVRLAGPDRRARRTARRVAKIADVGVSAATVDRRDVGAAEARGAARVLERELLRRTGRVAGDVEPFADRRQPRIDLGSQVVVRRAFDRDQAEVEREVVEDERVAEIGLAEARAASAAGGVLVLEAHFGDVDLRLARHAVLVGQDLVRAADLDAGAVLGAVEEHHDGTSSAVELRGVRGLVAGDVQPVVGAANRIGIDRRFGKQGLDAVGVVVDVESVARRAGRIRGFQSQGDPVTEHRVEPEVLSQLLVALAAEGVALAALRIGDDEPVARGEVHPRDVDLDIGRAGVVDLPALVESCRVGVRAAQCLGRQFADARARDRR